MVVTCADVVGRYFLNTPLPGGFELTEIMMAALIFLGMPLVTLSGEHIKVDLLDLVVSARVRRIQEVFAHLIGCGVSVLLAWTLWVKAGQVAAYQDRTETLGIPLAPIAYLMVAMMTVTGLIFAVHFVRGLMTRRM
jgi:TRAP-type C4-dicarboxylate transport system permease small subunit